MFNALVVFLIRSDYKLGADNNSKTGNSVTQLSKILSHANIPDGNFWKDCGNVASQTTSFLRIFQNQLKNKFSPDYSISL